MLIRKPGIDTCHGGPLPLCPDVPPNPVRAMPSADHRGTRGPHSQPHGAKRASSYIPVGVGVGVGHGDRSTELGQASQLPGRWAALSKSCYLLGLRCAVCKVGVITGAASRGCSRTRVSFCHGPRHRQPAISAVSWGRVLCLPRDREPCDQRGGEGPASQQDHPPSPWAQQEEGRDSPREAGRGRGC